jgi:hypothetical protein
MLQAFILLYCFNLSITLHYDSPFSLHRGVHFIIIDKMLNMTPMIDMTKSISAFLCSIRYFLSCLLLTFPHGIIYLYGKGVNNMDDLTKEQQLLLSEMYKDYLDLCDTLPSEKANNFGSSKDIKHKYLESSSDEYLTVLCSKLKSKGYITGMNYDNSVFNISLTDKTIIYFEQKFSRNIKSVLNFISALKK